MNTSSPLSIGQTLSSPGGFYELGFFTPNNTRNLYVGIWFKKIVPRVVVWVANRDTLVTNSPANPNISINGSLILLDGEQDVIWSTWEAFTSNKCHSELQDTENLVVIDDVSRTTIWQSFKNIGDTMLPHSSLMYDLSHGKKRVLTSWKSNSNPSPGSLSLEIHHWSMGKNKIHWVSTVWWNICKSMYHCPGFSNQHRICFLLHDKKL